MGTEAGRVSIVKHDGRRSVDRPMLVVIIVPTKNAQVVLFVRGWVGRSGLDRDRRPFRAWAGLAGLVGLADKITLRHTGRTESQGCGPPRSRLVSFMYACTSCYQYTT